jgi:hypothetical protein
MTKFDILQQSSGSFLTEAIPNNWLEMSEEEQNTFLEDHAWELLEDMPVNQVFELIENTANSTIRMLEMNGVKVD